MRVWQQAGKQSVMMRRSHRRGGGAGGGTALRRRESVRARVWVCVRVCNDDNTHMTGLLSGVGDVLIGYARADFFFFFWLTEVQRREYVKTNMTN